MGCINSNQGFKHWFGNIHLSGPCNRSCYFCIGQHMLVLDSLNNLNRFPLKNLDSFIERCKKHGIYEINLTGSNTDPLLYRHIGELHLYLKSHIPDLIFGIRTNGVLSELRKNDLKYFNKGSLSIHSFNKDIYKKMMGIGAPPDLEKILPHYRHFSSLKLNIVLGLENTIDDLLETIKIAMKYNFQKVNLREPYGQAHIGDPLAKAGFIASELTFGMPTYSIGGLKVTYWDVHFVEVESVNLYANGVISEDYSVTRGCDPKDGTVIPQEKWTAGRHYKQWV